MRHWERIRRRYSSFQYGPAYAAFAAFRNSNTDDLHKHKQRHLTEI